MWAVRWMSYNFLTLELIYVVLFFFFSGKPDDNPWLTSFSLWKKGKNGSTNTNCLSGYFVRDVCIFSPADLPRLVSTPYLFANKFYITHYPAALHCLDQRLFNNTISRETVQTDKYRKILRRRLSNSTLVKWLSGWWEFQLNSRVVLKGDVRKSWNCTALLTY